MTENHADAHAEHSAHDHHDHAEHGGVGKYLVVFAVLCVLTGMSFFTYSRYWPFPKHVAWAFMIAISCTKAMLVIMFFMHLLWEANWKWVLTIPASFMSIFLMLMLVPDVGMRQDNGYSHYSWNRWLFAANPLVVEASEEEAAEKEMSHDAPH
jgi:cytochrome c oxidase subunit 4